MKADGVEPSFPVPKLHSGSLLVLRSSSETINRRDNHLYHTSVNAPGIAYIEKPCFIREYNLIRDTPIILLPFILSTRKASIDPYYLLSFQKRSNISCYRRTDRTRFLPLLSCFFRLLRYWKGSHGFERS